MAYDNQGAAVGAAGHYASAIVAAFITAGVITGEAEALDSFSNLLPSVFAACEELKGTLPDAPAAPARSSGGRSWPKKSSGGGDSTDPGSVDFRSGKFAGKTIAEVYAIGGDEDGPGYLDWYANNGKNEFMAKRIAAYLETVAA